MKSGNRTYEDFNKFIGNYLHVLNKVHKVIPTISIHPYLSENKTFNDFNNFWNHTESVDDKLVKKVNGKLVKWYYDMFNIPIKDLL